MIAVVVSVQYDARAIAAEYLESTFYFSCQRRELVVDDQGAIGTGRHADITASALQHVEIFGDLLSCYVDIGKAVGCRQRLACQ